MKKSIDSFFNVLNIEEWFWRSFDSHKTDIETQAYNITNDIDYAVSVWQDNFEQRCDQWEILRVQLVDVTEWLQNFHIIRSKFMDMIKLNKSFKMLMQLLSNKYAFNEEQFISELPVIGLWGEKLLNIDDGYYSNQIIYYQDGFWVCGSDNGYTILY